ncbi:hypothetical protein V1499_23145 (plasmid) [Neobacillus sp. SCS-31]|uniref:hypothetical protein n=1 Tax=Neobacillus oceani TaxID=3115292 RepID=UPI0039057886
MDRENLMNLVRECECLLKIENPSKEQLDNLLGKLSEIMTISVESNSELLKMVREQNEDFRLLSQRLDDTTLEMEATLAVHEAFLADRGLTSDFDTFLDSIMADFPKKDKKLSLVKAIPFS